MRSQFSHVNDVAATVLEAAGIPEPIQVHGVTQSPYEGTSMVYSFNDAQAPERHEVQYFEMFGNRGVYYKGWSAVTKHRTPWKLGAGDKTIPFDDDVWELYDGSKDHTQAHDLAKEMPDMLHKLQRVFLIEAAKYNVLPLDDRGIERFNAELVGRPQTIKGKKQVLFPGMKRISESSVLNIKNKSFQVTAQLVVPADGGQGTIIAQGGADGGWGLMMEKGALRFAYNLLGVNVFVTDAHQPLAAGEHQVRMEFAYAGGGLAKGGAVTLYYDGREGGRRQGLGHPADGLFGDRGCRDRSRAGHHRAAQVKSRSQRVQRRDQVGGAEHRRRRSQPHDRSGRLHPHDHEQTVKKKSRSDRSLAKRSFAQAVRPRKEEP